LTSVPVGARPYDGNLLLALEFVQHSVDPLELRCEQSGQERTLAEPLRDFRTTNQLCVNLVGGEAGDGGDDVEHAIFQCRAPQIRSIQATLQRRHRNWLLGFMPAPAA